MTSGKKTDTEIAVEVAEAMIEIAIDMIDEKAGEDFDRCNMLLCMALGIALQLGGQVDEKIGRLAASVHMKESMQ